MIRKLIPFLAVVLVLGGSAAAPSLGAPKPPNTNVSVIKTGLQQATVTDTGGQIDCGSDCSGSYSAICGDTDIHGACIWDPGSTTLETTPPAGFRVVWGYDCEAEPSNDTDTCTISQSGGVEAHFDDTTAPTVGLTAPGGGAVTSGTIPLSATASDPQTGVASVQFYVDGAPVGSPDTAAPYSLSYDTTGHVDGSSVAVKARAVNADGDAAESTVNITIDNTAPELTMTGPDGTTSGPGTTQTWTYGASDATSGLSAVECSVAPYGAAPNFGARSPGAGTLSVSDKPDGHYLATIRATDAAGDTTLRSKTFSIDATAPQTSITGGPADGSSSSATTATFTFSASESGSTFECRVYPAALTPGAFGPCTGATTHTASGFSPGTYAFEVRATDAVGNVDTTAAKRTFTVTSPPPGGGNNGGANGGTGGKGGTNGGVTTTTTTTTVTTNRAIINAALSSDYDAFTKHTRSSGSSCGTSRPAPRWRSPARARGARPSAAASSRSSSRRSCGSARGSRSGSPSPARSASSS